MNKNISIQTIVNGYVISISRYSQDDFGQNSEYEQVFAASAEEVGVTVSRLLATD